MGEAMDTDDALDDAMDTDIAMGAVLKYYPEAIRQDSNVKELISFIINKDDFLRVYKTYNETSALEMYVLIICAVVNVVFEGDLETFKVLCTSLEWVHSVDITLYNGYEELKHPLKDTNLIILACKHNKTEILEWLLSNKNIVEMLCSQDIKLASEDEYKYNAVYYALRASSIDILQSLFNMEYSYEVLSKAYWELLLKNVLLSDDIHAYVVDKLIVSHGSINNDVTQTSDDNAARISFLLEQNKILQDEYLKWAADERFFCIARFITLNIKYLKGFMKSTDTVIPWEEMEFLLVIFISASLKNQELNIFYLTTINQDKLLKYLDCFLKHLDKSKGYIKNKCDRAMNRHDVINNIVKANPSFKNLYDDFYAIKDMYSLNMMKVSIEGALEVKWNTLEGQLVIKRSLQVSGEHLKNTKDSPNLSEQLGDLIIASAPTATRNILKKLRDSVSKVHSIDGDVEKLFCYIQNDIKKISFCTTEIFYIIKVIKIKAILCDIINCKNYEEMKPFLKVFRDKNSADSLETSIRKGKSVELQAMKDTIIKISNHITEKTESESQILTTIDDLFNKPYDEFKSSVMEYLETLNYLKDSCFCGDFPGDVEKAFSMIQYLAKRFLDNFTSQSESRNSFMNKIAKLLDELQRSLFERKSAQVNDMQSLIWIFNTLNICGNKSVQSVDTLLQRLSEFKLLPVKRTAKSIPVSDKSLKVQQEVLPNNITQLKRIILIDKILKKEKQIHMKSKNNNNSLLLEIVLMDTMANLDGVEGLAGHPLYLDDPVPLLTGRSLRNHLAHENTHVHILSTNIYNVLLSNAKVLSKHNLKFEIKQTETKKQNMDEVKRMHNEALSIIKTQKEMFADLANGNVENLEACIKKGADVYSRDMNLWSTAHYAAKSPNVRCLKYLQQRGVTLNVKDNNGQTPLHIAAANDRAENLEFLKDCDLKLEDTDCFGMTALHIASKNGHENSVIMLLELGAEWKIRDNDGHAPLHYAVISNHINITEILLTYDEDVDSNKTEYNYTALHLSSKFNCVQLTRDLIPKNANVNNIGYGEISPLDSAVIHDNESIVEILIAAKANLKSNDLFTKNVNILRMLLDAGVLSYEHIIKTLYSAAQNGFKEIVELLNEKVKIEKVNYLSALLYAAREGHKDIVEFLHKNGTTLDGMDDSGFTALHFSAMGGHTGVMQYLFDAGCKNIINDVKNKSKLSPLHLAVKYNKLEAVNLLLDKGANVQAVTCKGSTALHLSRNHCISEALINKGAKVNVMNNGNHSPLHLVVMTDSFNIETFDLLVKHKADVNSGAKQAENTPLHAAAYYGNIRAIEVLIKAKAMVDAETKYKETPLHVAVRGNFKNIVEVLLKNGADINKIGEPGVIGGMFTSLTIAISHNYEEMTKYLIESYADVNVGGGLPLNCAIIGNHVKLAEMLLQNKSINIDITDENGFTPLHIAAMYNNCKIGEILIKNGANLNAVSEKKNNRTPIIQAIISNKKEFCDMLFLNRAKVPEGLFLLDAIEKGFVGILQSFLENLPCPPKTLTMLLLTAVSTRQLEMVQYIIDKGADVNAKSRDRNPNEMDKEEICKVYVFGGTALHFAALEGCVKIAQYLIHKGANVNAINADGNQPFHIAAQNNHEEVVKLLLNSGAMYNYVNKQSKETIQYSTNINEILRLTKSLFEAVEISNIEEIKSLINQGACVNASDANNSTPLHFAAWKCDKNVCDTLLNYKAHTNTTNRNTPLHNASQYSNIPAILSLLSHGAIYNCLTEDGKSPLDFAEKPEIKLIFEVLDNLFTKAQNNIDIDEDFKKLESMDEAVRRALLKAKNQDNKMLMKVLITKESSKESSIKEMLFGKLIPNESIESNVNNTLEPIAVFFSNKVNNTLFEKFIDSVHSSSDLEEQMSIYLRMSDVLGECSQTLKLGYKIALILFKQGEYDQSLCMSLSILQRQKKIPNCDVTDVILTVELIADSHYYLGNVKDAVLVLHDIIKEQSNEKNIQLLWKKIFSILNIEINKTKRTDVEELIFLYKELTSF